MVIVDDDIGHVAGPAINQHPMRSIAAGAEDGAANGEDAGERGLVQFVPAFFNQTAEPVAKADNLHVVKSDRSFPNPPDGCIQSGTIPACRQDSDALGLGH